MRKRVYNVIRDLYNDELRFLFLGGDEPKRFEAREVAEMSELEFCPLAELPPRNLRRFVRSGRICKSDGLICHGWSDPAIYISCPVRKSENEGLSSNCQ